MSDVIHQRDCLGCGAPLGGKYCGRCGQRNIAAYPSAWELLGDGWQKLRGYYGRFVSTIRALLRRPGAPLRRRQTPRR